jgi:hypothetical protein
MGSNEFFQRKYTDTSPAQLQPIVAEGYTEGMSSATPLLPEDRAER